jgi:hypothetical protein
MSPEKQLKLILSTTKILQSPKHRLSTFGNTRIRYFFISEVTGMDERSRLREGIVLAERPKIITPDSMRDRFEGFGKGAEEFGEWLGRQYGFSIRGLEYQFKNQESTVHVEHSPVRELAERIKKDLAGRDLGQSALIEGPDDAWQISLMKFILEESMASFDPNMRELHEHGFFDGPQGALQNRRREIEALLFKARSDRALIPILGRKLQDHGLFSEYEDRFFSLFKNQ